MPANEPCTTFISNDAPHPPEVSTTLTAPQGKAAWESGLHVFHYRQTERDRVPQIYTKPMVDLFHDPADHH